MAEARKIDRVRRQYNQWVANQTLEDYALRFTAMGARKWSPARVANTAIGAISFLALEAIGGAITLSYGVSNAVAAILAVGAILFATGLPISYYAAKYGVDIDLLTRGAGFGYIGSTITSLIYASFTFIFFALEAAIMAVALELCFGVPQALGYVVSALVVIPLVTHGITFISRFQLWTQPVWIALNLLPFVVIAATSASSFDGWLAFPGRQGTPEGTFDLLLFGAAAAVTFSLIAQIGEQVDFLRFLPRQRAGRRLSWWLALVSAGPGWAVLGVAKLIAGSFLAYFALVQGVPIDNAAEPAQMYLAAFRHAVGTPEVALALTGLFVVVAQLKINVTNAYAGSIAWSNFFSRLTHSHPGRVVWLVFNVLVALLLMELGIYKALERILALYSNVAIAWLGALVADLVVNKPLGLSPPHIEFKRAHLYDVNPVGVGAMLLATLASIVASTGAAGETAQALTPFVTLAVAFIAAPAIAWATGGRYYLAREAQHDWKGATAIRCCICEHAFEAEDMARCPAYSGPICSLCCSLDARCHDLCKTGARLPDQILAGLTRALPMRIVARLNSRLGHFLGVFLVSCVLLAVVLALVYFQSRLDYMEERAIIGAILWKVFAILIIIVGVTAWLFVLAAESRRAAQKEAERQTELLMREIEAHERTDAELQRAKEAAEAANLAKSRYVVGLSHELRTPLNAISGYAQLIEQDMDLSPRRRGQVGVIRRSTEHLSGLIDGLLDISKIEAGRLHLEREEVRLREFLDQLVGMVRLQARAKGIDFIFDCPANLPEAVYTDEKRLRQILINLVSNAIKFTERGHVRLRVHYRSPVAEFEIEDTGVGIRPEDIERIFEPFARGALPPSSAVAGTGLGLTISKLLAGIMGGAITVTSEVGRGSTFRVKLVLSEVSQPSSRPADEERIRGYRGPRLTVLVIDDDPPHRDLVHEILAPLGFIVLQAPDGTAGLDLADLCRPDVVLLDIAMPGGPDGWQVAQQLRERGLTGTRIIMISANALEAKAERSFSAVVDDVMMKPTDIRRLLDKIRRLTGIEWIEDGEDSAPERDEGAEPPVPALPADVAGELGRLARIGHARALRDLLGRLAAAHPVHARLAARLTLFVDRYDFDGLSAALAGAGGPLKRERQET
ncbi:signal transduction histidine kinase/CheY-like chemotaxis protein [Chelatococcus caeni]|uniref:histidine kinase n=1 Tax=Chelatococcus caeni TaxID=1348468 RepID=A0A840C7U5_9HYPH|nr:ATP-binding protein [Chelatococcus caeni]MBB4018966.1 signal transduction histidine kinase/CheY-like chemotaxis protein [Chelatococcus caeni]